MSRTLTYEVAELKKTVEGTLADIDRLLADIEALKKMMDYKDGTPKKDGDKTRNVKNGKAQRQ